jgi:integrase
MLVKDHFENFIQNHAYRYQTKINMKRCLTKLGLLDIPYSEVTPNLVWTRLEGILNINVRRSYSGYIRNIFGYTFNQMPVVMGMPRTYDLPPQNVIHEIIESTKYRFYLYLCMYAGLSVGEACAVVPSQVKKERDNYWLNVDRAYSQDGTQLSSPKTIGKVLIPEWLALEILAMKETDYWQKGVPTSRITNGCNSLGHKQKVHINPHMLRHWFATDMVRRHVPPHVIMKQMRHKTINTTMQIYAQVNNDDFVNAMPQRPEVIQENIAKVIPLRHA